MLQSLGNRILSTLVVYSLPWVGIASFGKQNTPRHHSCTLNRLLGLGKLRKSETEEQEY